MDSQPLLEYVQYPKLNTHHAKHSTFRDPTSKSETHNFPNIIITHTQFKTKQHVPSPMLPIPKLTHVPTSNISKPTNSRATKPHQRGCEACGKSERCITGRPFTDLGVRASRTPRSCAPQASRCKALSLGQLCDAKLCLLGQLWVPGGWVAGWVGGWSGGTRYGIHWVGG